MQENSGAKRRDKTFCSSSIYGTSLNAVFSHYSGAEKFEKKYGRKCKTYLEWLNDQCYKILFLTEYLENNI